jgi:hydroxyacylglutathione hydrolase
VLLVDPARVDEAVRDLVRIGLDRVVGFFDAARFGELAAAGATIAKTREIAASDTDSEISTRAPFVLDVRRATEHAAGNIAGALNIAHTRLLGKLAEVPKERELLVHCQAGLRSARACALLERHGYTVTNMGGGFGAYAKTKTAACAAR